MANAESSKELPARQPSLPYNYTYLTDQMCQEWDSRGKQQIMQQASQTLHNGDETELMILFQELVQSSLSKRLDPSQLGAATREILKDAEAQQNGQDTLAVEASLTDAISVVYENDPDLPFDALGEFVVASTIPFEFLRHELDVPLLEKLELLRTTFVRMGIRKQTNVLYRQANFNLMREESEGFAKLITELFDISSTDHPSADNVEESVQRVKALIGAFDLDVGRSLDVVLDVFGSVLVKQCRFFVKFLRASPWWPRKLGSTQQETSGLPIWALPGSQEWFLTASQKEGISARNRRRDANFWVDAQQEGLRAFYKLGLQKPPDQAPTQSAVEGDFAKAWFEQTGMQLPDGNRDAAQLLGFKLRFYSSSPARDENDILPDNLIHLSALLIKIGFISLKDLYPHLWRPDDKMDELKQQKLKEKEEREKAARPGAGAKNALAMAGALADDTAPVPSRLRESNTRAGTPAQEVEAAKSASKEAPSEPVDQKVTLLKSLLAIGALPEALFILGRFPWVTDLYTELPDYINRILQHCLTEVYEAARPLVNRHSLSQPRPLYETDVPGVPKGQVRLSELTERKVLRWAQLDRNDSSDGTDYRFYWDEWADNIPMCQTVEDVFILCKILLPLVGVKIGQDPALALKLARIGKYSLQTDRSEANQTRWLDLSKRVLLPALSLTKPNADVVNETFELISNFSINTRYLMYIEWSAGRMSRNPDVRSVSSLAAAETRSILKRMSKENYKPIARQLARVAYANPITLITTALTQIESYDSISKAFVEGARYFTDLGYDVLTWAIISSMSRAGRQRVQEGGLFASPWLQALAHFAGNIYKRYGMMKPGPLLQHIAHQLDDGQTTDLIMLEHMVFEMTGVTINVSLNEKQLQAMGGGPLLQSLIFQQIQDRRNDSTNRSSSKRLLKVLQDNGLMEKFLVSIAQQRQACIYRDGDIPLKAAANTFDEVHRILVQYLGFLKVNLSVDDLSKIIPDVVDLMIGFEIRPEIAFLICRPILAKQIAEFERDDAASPKIVESSAKETNGDIEMLEQADESSEEDGEAQESDEAVPPVATPTEADILGSNLEQDITENGMTQLPGDDSVPWHPVLKEVMDKLDEHVPDQVADLIGSGFFVTFWQLSLYDINIPSNCYQEEQQKQRSLIAKIGSDRSDVTVSAAKKRDVEKQGMQDVIDKLMVEYRQQLQATKEARKRLQREKDRWFMGKSKVTEQLNGALMEYCFLPRILVSPLDALFCFKFVKLMHVYATANFRTIGFFDLLFRSSRLASLIFMCSSDEADNMGLFLKEVLRDLGRWHGSKATYEKEAWGANKQLPGFAKVIDGGTPKIHFEFEDFRKALYKWHVNMQAALVKCLTSPEYMHVRNAISVSQAVSDVYPVVNWHGIALQKAVDKLKASDKEDLRVSSQALLGTLTRKSKAWIPPQAFRQGQDKSSEELEAAAAAKSSSTSQPTAVKKDRGEKGATDAPIPDQPFRQADHRKEIPREPRKDTPTLPSKPGPLNGVSARTASDLRSSERTSRQPRSETPKPAPLPRKLSPAPRHQPPANLPSRPDPTDTRNSRDARVPPRPAIDPARPLDSRNVRPGPRAPEPPFDGYDRHQRRHERDDPPTARDARGYGRELDSERPYQPDALRMPDRDRVSERDRAPHSSSRERGPRDRTARSTTTRQQPSEEPRLRPPASAPARPTSSQADAVAVNPDRAALINSPEMAQPPNMSIRGHAQERASRAARTSSPKRDDERRGPLRQDREERYPTDRRSEIPLSRQPPPSSMASVAPRSSYNSPSSRDNRHSQGPQVDMQHGRLEQDSSQRPATRTERPPEPDVPSGPRARGTMAAPNGRGAPSINTQLSQPSRDRPTPTGPARHSRNNSYHDASSSAPPTPDTTGVHPSRLNQIAPSPTENSRPPAPLPPPPPPPAQSSPPAGPRSSAPSYAPSGPSPTTRAPPAGPQSSEPSTRGGRSNRHPLAAVNNALTQAGQSPSTRGRGASRQSLNTFTPQAPTGPQGHSQRSELPPQQDLFASSNPNGMPIASRPPSSRHESTRDRRHEGEEREGERRSGRRHDEPRERDSRHGEREGRDDRDSSRREERPSRREEPPQAEERRGYRNGPRDEPSRKHGRGDEGGPYPGGAGRGGSRVASENKRARRGS